MIDVQIHIQFLATGIILIQIDRLTTGRKTVKRIGIGLLLGTLNPTSGERVYLFRLRDILGKGMFYDSILHAANVDLVINVKEIPFRIRFLSVTLRGQRRWRSFSLEKRRGENSVRTIPNEHGDFSLNKLGSHGEPHYDTSHIEERCDSTLNRATSIKSAQVADSREKDQSLTPPIIVGSVRRRLRSNQGGNAGADDRRSVRPFARRIVEASPTNSSSEKGEVYREEAYGCFYIQNVGSQ
ncbi:hypothetical protein ARMSODRAFT_977760 [Armillaria solidipes]|uniref:Uncharacterized protein n=1 Tax=Armillaria solidipes TaxID=1076256 RepID=A0A2H3BQE9_9AGAR|nr:hypothetical protein ARMSODRAFT_977760 [Armillaria solidipes]